MLAKPLFITLSTTSFLLSVVVVIIFSTILSVSSFSFFPPPTTSNPNKKTAAAANLSKIPIVICPGFGNDAIDYSNPLSRGEEYGFVNALIRRGFNPDLIQVLPLKRYEWIRVAGGLFDLNFYTMTCRPEGLGYGWYVRRLRRTIEDSFQKSGGERCLVIGHSAGGWLARASLGDGSWDVVEQANNNDEETRINNNSVRAADRVRALITIGAIHKPPEKDYESTCVTRGALSYLEANYPGAFLADEGISYVSIGGDGIMGRQSQQTSRGNDNDLEKLGSMEANQVYKIRGEVSASSVAYTSYAAVSGNGERTGDGVVPLEWSLLDGSRTIVLDGVLHSINEAGTTVPTDRWYGADAVLDRWLQEALEEAGIKTDGKKREQPSTILDSLQKMLSF